MINFSGIAGSHVCVEFKKFDNPYRKQKIAFVFETMNC